MNHVRLSQNEWIDLVELNLKKIALSEYQDIPAFLSNNAISNPFSKTFSVELFDIADSSQLPETFCQ